MNIVIAGGGLSGWISAFLLSSNYPEHSFIIIDSQKIPNIGVGEGTSGYFVEKLILGTNKFTTQEFFRETKATPKLGIEFNDWDKIGDSFLSPIDCSITKDLAIDYSVYVDYINNNRVGDSSKLGLVRKEKNTPFYKNSNKFNFYDLGVHLDNSLTINFLKKHALTNKNLKCIDTVILSVVKNKDGIHGIVCENNFLIEGDLFLDCTGFKRILTKDRKWISFNKNLPVNSVITFQMKHDGNIDLVTQANAMKNGWTWVIPTQERYGAGYVYCDYYTNEEQCTNEILDKYPSAKIGKKFSFKSGKQNECWTKNVISIGLSYHFLEPLQATSIHFILTQLDLIGKYCIKPTKEMSIDALSRKKYNSITDNIIDNYRDFVNVQYSGSRTDTKFWKMISKKQHLSEFSKLILDTAKRRGLYFWDFPNGYSTFDQELWMYTVLGLNHISTDKCHEILLKAGLLEVSNQKWQEHITKKEFKENFINYDEFINRLYI
jgi:tryptophan halogenase